MVREDVQKKNEGMIESKSKIHSLFGEHFLLVVVYLFLSQHFFVSRYTDMFGIEECEYIPLYAVALYGIIISVTFFYLRRWTFGDVFKWKRI